MRTFSKRSHLHQDDQVQAEPVKRQLSNRSNHGENQKSSSMVCRKQDSSSLKSAAALPSNVSEIPATKPAPKPAPPKRLGVRRGPLARRDMAAACSCLDELDYSLDGLGAKSTVPVLRRSLLNLYTLCTSEQRVGSVLFESQPDALQKVVGAIGAIQSADKMVSAIIAALISLFSRGDINDAPLLVSAWYERGDSVLALPSMVLYLSSTEEKMKPFDDCTCTKELGV
eukprot:2631949-Pleurochrysis_carterae.AAC.2